MYQDVRQLRDFYYRSVLGRAAQSVIRADLRGFWPNTTRETVAGFGFAVPFLRPFLPEARRVVGLMPSQQGVLAWPPGKPSITALTEEARWPVETGTLDRLLVIHALDLTENPSHLLEECYRTLAPHGRAVFVVPNRRGLWARGEHTPFGQGRPYSIGQLEQLLRSFGLLPGRSISTLYQLPATGKLARRTAGLFERGGRHLPVFLTGGVLMVEVTKQIPAPMRPGLAARRSRPLKILNPLPEPALPRVE